MVEDEWGDELGVASEAKTVVLVSPAMQEANNGNWHTAHRWAQFLSSHCDIALLPAWPAPLSAPTADAMIALHARRSAPSIHAWAQQYPGKPLILVLTGTDLYRDILGDADAQQSLRLATHLVVLQEAGLQQVPPAWRNKTRVIYQSARALCPAVKSTRQFRALMVGHLRDEKDPLTYLRAAARPFEGRMLFEHIGEALQPELALAARAAENTTPGYRWLGGLPRAQTRQHIKRAHVLVNSSRMEGGAQVILEAVQSGTPVLASAISGNIGMLGADYAGYFALGDDGALAALLQRCAAEPGFLALLQEQCRQRAHLFSPPEEKRRVLNLLHSALKPSAPCPDDQLD
ncbi:selenoneine biosynthesis selenosugar synthase SenB [Polaromonas sp. SM01]|uniref:selenoneine biosynthesis selenosugar synthase SenB n=1 Tax=Polaromonas sp. SM01 TaxID=3085630 RepID=UPI0029827FA9|nr:selenoneine biosynthesis selenosugar synthase SenB [Polaromonas sp. SM01]MDW5442947.1 selenoneine biosynthesis selenosugar synthase SenB [Polaromonas sp. SM01]